MVSQLLLLMCPLVVRGPWFVFAHAWPAA